MKLHLNFRSDLRELSDAKLAEHYEAISELREKLGLVSSWTDPIVIVPPLIRHPSYYRFIAILAGGGGSSALDAAFGAWIASSPSASSWLLKWDRGANVFILNCELMDLHDELERRIKLRKGSRA